MTFEIAAEIEALLTLQSKVVISYPPYPKDIETIESIYGMVMRQ